MRSVIQKMILTACSVLLAAPSAEAQTYIYGIELRRDDFVGGRVMTSVGKTASVDLVARTGIDETDRLWLFRKEDRVGSQYRLIGQVVVVKVKPRFSVVRATGTFRIQIGDRAVIPARELDLWSGQQLASRRLKARILDQQKSNERDSRDLEVDGNELLWELRSERFRDQQLWQRLLQRTRPRGPAFYDFHALQTLIRSGQKRELPDDRELAIDPERLLEPLTQEFIGFPILDFTRVTQADAETLDPLTAPADDTTSDEGVTDVRLPDSRTRLGAWKGLRDFLRKQLSSPAT